MRIKHLDEGVGRIVKGVNTTPDVGVGEIPKQAAKFGNKVDKDGRPPTLSSKVKGKSTNVLFNLGLTESLPKDPKADFLDGERYYEQQFEIYKVGVDFYIEDGLPVTPDVIRSWGDVDNRLIDMLMDYYKRRGGKVEEARYTAAEWAIIEGGHSLEETAQQPKKSGRIFAALTEDVEIDNKDGWGAVPWNQEIDYRGLRVKMKPSVFINLAASRNGEPPVPKVVDYVKGGGAIGAPFLQIFVDEDDSQIPEVRGHEGRSRMAAILEVHGDVPVETHLFFQGKVNRNRHITPEFVEKIQRYLISENDKMVRGPLFEI